MFFKPSRQADSPPDLAEIWPATALLDDFPAAPASAVKFAAGTSAAESAASACSLDAMEMISAEGASFCRFCCSFSAGASVLSSLSEIFACLAMVSFLRPRAGLVAAF